MIEVLKVSLLGLAMALGLPLSAHAGAKTPDVLDDERLVEVRPEMKALFGEVKEAGLPVALFEAKTREGLVKKVEPSKILGALEKLEKRCAAAKKLIEKSGIEPTATSIGRTAELMRLGVGEKEIERLLDGLAKAKADAVLLEKGLLAAIVMLEKGTTGPVAVDGVLSIVGKEGKKGLDAWLKGEATKGSKDLAGDKKSKTKKAKPGKGSKKSPGKGKSPCKPHKPHGK